MTRAAKQDDIQDEDTIEFRLLLNNWWFIIFKCF
jgi:hypothetical protein